MRVRLLSEWASTSFRMVGLLWILYLYSSAAVGADIRVYKSPSPGGIDIIQYSGDVQQGDYEAFVGLLEPNQKALLVLSSNGGSLRDGLQIGIEVRLRGISTSVMADKECYSACALIWLAGRKRLMAETSRIGFHAAYIMDNGKASESGMANAEVGNYLTRLGIGIEAIRYFTSAPPNDLRFIDFETAAALNIAVSDSGSLPTIPAGNPLTRSASFDCKKAATPDEMAVCSDENLSELDISLAAEYGQAIRTASRKELRMIKEDQRRWLAKRRSCGSNIECLTGAYADRLGELRHQTTSTEANPTTIPSFDCSRARSEDEVAICGNRELAQMDVQVGSLYRAATRGLSGSGLESARSTQRSWLKDRAQCGGNETCLRSVYSRRLSQLGSH